MACTITSYQWDGELVRTSFGSGIGLLTFQTTSPDIVQSSLCKFIINGGEYTAIIAPAGGGYWYFRYGGSTISTPGSYVAQAKIVTNQQTVYSATRDFFITSVPINNNPPNGGTLPVGGPEILSWGCESYSPTLLFYGYLKRGTWATGTTIKSGVTGDKIWDVSSINFTVGQLYSWRVDTRSNSGDNNYGTVCTFTGAAALPSKPINPTPVNSAVEVDFSNFTLSWQNGGGATSYDVYIGPVGALIKVSSGQVGTIYITNISQVPYNQKIYWRIDAINASGTTTGDVWNFDARPAKVTLPVPDDGTDGVDLGLNELSWAESDLATEYDFYFREEGDDWEYVGETDELIYNIPIAFSKYFQVYEWRIDAKNQFGITTGDTWSFIIIHSRKFPYERRSDYSGIIGDDLVWDISSQAWTSDFDYLVAGGGRYRNQLVIVGHEVVYFGDI